MGWWMLDARFRDSDGSMEKWTRMPPMLRLVLAKPQQSSDTLV